MSNYKNEIAKIAEIAEKVYLKGYWEGRGNIRKDEAYQKGLNDAWEAARKIVKIEYEEAHDVWDATQILESYSAVGAIEKIKEYESHVPDKDVGEIKIGDEVIVRDEEKGVVTTMTPYEITILIDTGGWCICTKRKNVKKTGKHYSQIAEVLRQMKGASE